MMTSSPPAPPGTNDQLSPIRSSRPTDSTGSTVYLPGGTEISVSTSNVVSVVRWYSFGGQVVAYRTGAGSAKQFTVFTDHQGSPIGSILNTDWAGGINRTRTDPFGAGRSTTTSTAGRGFLAATIDTTGLVSLGARYYDPAAGVFVSVDPLLDKANTAQFNAYVYSGNNPITWSDPSGLAWVMRLTDGGAVTSKKAAAPASVQNYATGGTSRSSTNGISAPAYMGGCGSSYNPCGAPKLTAEQKAWPTLALHGLLTAAGFIPVAGEVADGLDAIVSLSEGDNVGAALSATSMIPFLGWGTALTKFGKLGEKAAEVGTDAAKVAPPIKPGASGGATASKPFPQSVRQEALNENPRTCVYCRIDTDSPQVDHAVPKARGGDATLENAQTTCPHCNASKGARDYPVTPPADYRGTWPPSWWRDPQ